MYGRIEPTKREEILDEYKGDVEKLMRYLPWLNKVTGQDVERYYEGDGQQPLIQIPVYDSTLLSFIKDAEQTQFMSKNYPYIYSRYQIKSPEDEKRLMQAARIQEMDLFKGILSKYVLEGKRRAVVWNTGVREGVFLTALECLAELFFRYAP